MDVPQQQTEQPNQELPQVANDSNEAQLPKEELVDLNVLPVVDLRDKGNVFVFDELTAKVDDGFIFDVRFNVGKGADVIFDNRKKYK